MSEIKDKLLGLPTEIPDSKIDFWLAYKKIKPVSTVLLQNESDKDKLLELLKISDMKYTQDNENKKLFFVSKSQKYVDEISQIMWSEDKDDIIRKSELFGYPKEASIAYAEKVSQGISPGEDNSFKVVLPINSDYYWSAYARYIVRRDQEVEDTQVAKKWADCIRHDLPELAKEFEKQMAQTKDIR